MEEFLVSGRQELKYQLQLNKMKPLFLVLSVIYLNSIVFAQRKTIDQRVDSVLQLMTLEEKVGQMNQYNGPWAATGPLTNNNNLLITDKGR